MFNIFKANSNEIHREATSKYLIAKTGEDILNVDHRKKHVTKIKRLFSVTDSIWLEHYYFAIKSFAEIVQEVPASEIHHHSNVGGLIDHTLETLHAGIRISHGYVLPPNTEPEEITSAADRWRFAALIAILAHDIGKIVTDIEVVYSVNDGGFQHWHPWYSNIPVGSEYIYRYKKREGNTKSAKSLHEKAAMSLLPRLLTKEAADWIFEDSELLSQLFSTVSHSTFGGQVISEIVRTADCSSVARDLGADTGVKTDHSSAVPLHEKLIVSLRKLINDGDLKRNRPGAAVWVTDNETWVVSKAGMEAVRAQLINEGHKGIPKNVVRLFEVLREHELLIPNIEGDSVWSAEINDFAKNWKQKLTFLRFNNALIWPTSNPSVFDGEITPVDRKGNPLNIDESKITAETNNVDIEDAIEKLTSKVEDDIDIPPGSVTKMVQKPKVSVPKSKKTIEPQNSEQSGISSKEAKQEWRSSRQVQEDILAENDFIGWLLKGIRRRHIRVNEPAAPVHILDEHVALVTPSIFILYLEKNSLKKALYEKRAGDKKIYTLLQKELQALDIHQKGTNGQNISKMSVEGQRSQSELSVYLLNKDCFPSLANFTSNQALRLHL
ncbi:MAG: relaxase [Thiotrichaceae bacterium]|nr:MAG: relaxase [Thiotrichaceae bacterium]